MTGIAAHQRHAGRCQSAGSRRRGGYNPATRRARRSAPASGRRQLSVLSYCGRFVPMREVPHRDWQQRQAEPAAPALRTAVTASRWSAKGTAPRAWSAASPTRIVGYGRSVEDSRGECHRTLDGAAFAGQWQRFPIRRAATSGCIARQVMPYRRYRSMDIAIASNRSPAWNLFVAHACRMSFRTARSTIRCSILRNDPPRDLRLSGYLLPADDSQHQVKTSALTLHVRTA